MTGKLVPRFDIGDNKTNFNRILDRVERGEEVLVFRAGKAVAKLVPLTHRVNRTGRGSLAGKLELADDWDSRRINDAIADTFGRPDNW